MDHRIYHNPPCLGDPSSPVFQVCALSDSLLSDSIFSLIRTEEDSCIFQCVPNFSCQLLFGFEEPFSFAHVCYGECIVYERNVEIIYTPL